jgi:hypothetical protein
VAVSQPKAPLPEDVVYGYQASRNGAKRFDQEMVDLLPTSPSFITTPTSPKQDNSLNTIRHLSSFTNLQKLHLRATPIHGFTEEELSMCFKQMGRSVRSVSLRACKMTINDLVSFMRSFRQA